jgi:peptide/nickel transport system substrate-binding protein
MKKTKYRALIILSVIILISMLATGLLACGQPAAAKGNFIDGSYGGDGETLNYLLASDATSSGYIGLTIDSLANYDPKLDTHLLCLAKDVETSTDGLTYTMTIRDDLKWSNGSQVTAEDYVYTIENLMLSDWLNYEYKQYWQEMVDGKLVPVNTDAVSNTVFTIKRKTIDPEFVYTIYGLVPYPKYITTKYEGNLEAFTRAPEFNELSYTGNLGPYKYKEWIRNDRFVVERNPDYYLGKAVGAPYFGQYTTKIFGTSATMLAALEAGDITSAGIEPEKVAKFKGLKNINVYTVPTTGYNFVGYNMRRNGWEGLRNKTVRQALSMAISKQQICDKIYLGFAEPAYSFIPKVSPWYDGESVVKFGVDSLYNKQKALEMLQQEGFARKDSSGKLTATNKDGSPLKLTLLTTTGGGIAENIAFMVKQELADIGITVELKLVPWENLLRQYLENKVPGSNQTASDNNGPDAVGDQPWDLVLMGFTTDLNSPSGSSVFFTTDGGLNFVGYFNKELDALFDSIKTRAALDKKVRAEIYAKISHTLSDDQPVDFLVFRLGNVGFQKNVKGIEPGLNMGYNFYLWHFE